MKLREIMENVSSSEGADGSEYSKSREVKNLLIIAINSNRGLAGAFNSNIIRAVNKLINDDYKELRKQGGVKVLSIGKKASDFYSKSKDLFMGHHNEIYNHLDFEAASAIASSVMNDFKEGKFDKVILVYNQFKNAAVQYVQVEQMLPMQADNKKEAARQQSDYIFEPNKADIIMELIPKSIRIQLYKALLDSHASEHGARMTAMNKATDNAGELIRELRISYNKARQAAITNEILEIVAGAEALNG
jgi:F-type H+-transporting ATPase subunit gamma